jgi:hypothetical protein
MSLILKESRKGEIGRNNEVSLEGKRVRSRKRSIELEDV